MAETLQEYRILCKTCWAGGQKSKVYPTFHESGGKEGVVFYDENGKYHVHETSEKYTKYTCSNGHTWEGVEEHRKCWCGWKEGEEK